MVEWAAADDRVCGFGETGTVVVSVDGWEPCGSTVSAPTLMDTNVAGETRGVVVPVDTTLHNINGETSLSTLDTICLPRGEHHLRFERGVETVISFAAAATGTRRDGEFHVAFAAPTPVTVGFREPYTPRQTVCVPETPDGLAAAVTAAGAGHETAGPERSHPGFRPRTPALTFGECSVPTSLSNDASVSFEVPDSSTAVLVAAPLAYYLGARVRTGSTQPRLVGPALDHTFSPLPAFADEVADALRNIVWFDASLRDVPGERRDDVSNTDVGNRAIGSASPAERLAATFELSGPSSLTWPLTGYVDDRTTSGRFLPYLLDRLSLVYPAHSSPLNPKALLKRSLDEFYRGEVANVEALDPRLADSRYHVWLADGTPIDAYALLPEALEHTPEQGETLRIAVVCNDERMGEERDVAELYRRRIGDPRVEVRVRERCHVDELAAVFETPNDFVHFIGHCETGGLVCPDGTFAAAALETCRTSTFFLNACGSYYEGYDLVRRGASVGGVTLTTVFDDQALKVGTAFAALLADGFAFEPAMRVARGQIRSGRDYAIVGDGSVSLTSSTGAPVFLRLDDADDGARFDVTYEPATPTGAGVRYRNPFDGTHRLHGEPTRQRVDRDDVLAFLQRHDVPVRYDRRLYRSETLARRLSTRSRNPR